MTKPTWKSDVEKYEALRDVLIALSYSLKVMHYPGISAAVRQFNGMLLMSNVWFSDKPANQWRHYGDRNGCQNLLWLINQFTGIACYFELAAVIHSYHPSGSNPRMAQMIREYNNRIRSHGQYQRAYRFEEDHYKEFNLPKTAFYVLREISANGKVQINGKDS